MEPSDNKELTKEEQKKLIEARRESEIAQVRPEDITDLLPTDERRRREEKAKKLEEELERELGL
ncbi:MAG: hypothetical protein K6G50_00665 [bacterium]|nr:hypothetical protein [bacterium]